MEADDEHRQKYARAFGVPLESVEVREAPDDSALVYAPSRPDLPTWDTGRLP